MEHLLRLADEYQTKSVFDVCLNYLKVLPGSKENAVRTLFLTNMAAMARGDRRLDIVRSGCYNLIKDMSLQDIVKKDDFKNLERDSVESVLVERVKKIRRACGSGVSATYWVSGVLLSVVLRAKKAECIFP